MKTLIFHLAMTRSRKVLVAKYGMPFWFDFKGRSGAIFQELAPELPDLGNSLFAFNFQFAPAYAAWYRALTELGRSRDEAVEIIWLLNERLVTIIPKPFLHRMGKAYFSGFRKKAPAHELRQKRGDLHPWDWTIHSREIDRNTFEIDITRCAMQRFACEHGAEGMLPGICRMDYLFSWLMGNGFQRTKTLGDGDDCCNCHYQLEGTCEWSPEKGFAERK